jgi:hypothetical protein
MLYIILTFVNALLPEEVVTVFMTVNRTCEMSWILNLHHSRAMAQAVSHRSLTAESRVRVCFSP